jgi:hypothetical protein
MNKDLKKILKAAQAAGFETRTTNKGHIVVTKDGRRVTTFAGTASDYRSIRNGLAALRHAGFEWPPRR